MDTPSPPTPTAGSDEDRFAAFYGQAYLPVLRFTLRRVPPERAEDLVSEAFVVVWRRLADLPDDDNEALAWTLGVTRNLILNDSRAQVRRRSLLLRLADDHRVDQDLTGAPSLQELDGIAAVWPRLRAEDQEVLALTYWDELTSAQAATVLNISPVAVRLRLTRARRNLRRHLDLTPDPADPADTAQLATAPASRRTT